MKLNTPLKAKDLAIKYKARLIGNEDAELGSLNEIHKLTTDSLTFVDHEKYFNKVIASKAKVILINQAVKCPEGKALLVVENPFQVYNDLALDSRPFIPSSAMISPLAEIGEGTILQPNVFVGNHVKIGKNCIIHPHVSIYDYTEIGDNVIIHANTTIGSDAYYLHKKGNTYEKMHTIGRAIIEDDVEIGSSCSIDSGVSGDTVVGKGSKLDSQVHVGHGVVIGKHCLLCAQVAIAGKSIIGDEVILYGKVGVSKDIKIGDKSIVLASSNVDKDLEAEGTYFGSPAINARDKWKEMAIVRMLPKMWSRIMFKD
jgi:UDP-3-O-[3-hydroxymyristoyl] glucosamine N-acyltransferase